MSMGETSVRLTAPSRVVRLVLERPADQELMITLTLVSDGTSSTNEVRFRGVSDVHFRGDRTELSGIVLFLVEDISSRGWEGARFRVKDYEEEFLSFQCREIDPPLFK